MISIRWVRSGRYRVQVLGTYYYSHKRRNWVQALLHGIRLAIKYKGKPINPGKGKQ